MIRGLVLLALAGCADDGAPHLASATPAATPRRGHVVLAGERLCGATGDCTHAAGAVRIGDSASVVQAQVIAYADGAAEIAIPEITPVGPTSLVITVNELASNALAFEVLP